MVQRLYGRSTNNSSLSQCVRSPDEKHTACFIENPYTNQSIWSVYYSPVGGGVEGIGPQTKEMRRLLDNLLRS